MMRRSKLFIIILLLLASLGALSFYATKMNGEKSVKINNTIIKVEIADTPQKQARGLGARQSLATDQGMLFIFGSYQIRRFWMKDMRFSIDIVWIKDNLIAGCEKNVLLTDSLSLKTYLSPIPVNYVLEINAGFCDQYNVKAGDRVDFNL